MISRLRILAFWILVQFSATGWAAGPSNTGSDASANPPANAPKGNDVPGYELPLKLQESLQTGQDWGALSQQLYTTLFGGLATSASPEVALAPAANPPGDNENQPTNAGQDLNGLPQPLVTDNAGLGWDAFNQEFFASLMNNPDWNAPDNPADNALGLPDPGLTSGYSGENWAELSQQLIDSLYANTGSETTSGNGAATGDNLGLNSSENNSGLNGFDNYFSNSSTSGVYSPVYGNSAYNSSGGFGGGFTAAGFFDSLANDVGYTNTFIGSFALNDNRTGHNNTAIGVEALFRNRYGRYNTANGSRALKANVSGHYNTATGGGAMKSNISGHYNTANGHMALYSNKTGISNSANGLKALFSNTSGNYNTADGVKALYANVMGKINTAIGISALSRNRNGMGNTALGSRSLAHLTYGGYNLALGVNAGINLKQGNNNVYLASSGASSESLTIRIGESGYARTFIGGIRGRATGMPDSVPVVIDSNGQLGTINSSARFKKDIKDMNDASRGLLKLRPVTYRYKQSSDNGKNPIEYGLIAEEVARVYPELVAHSADGQIETVQYHKLTPMLLNELQTLYKALESAQANEKILQAQLADEKLRNQAQATDLAALMRQVETLTAQSQTIAGLSKRLARIESQQFVGWNGKPGSY